MKKISLIIISVLCFFSANAQTHHVSEKELMEHATQLFSIPALASIKDAMSNEDFSFVQDTTEVAYEIYDLMFKMDKTLFTSLETGALRDYVNKIWTLYTQNRNVFAENSFVPVIANMTMGLMGAVAGDNQMSLDYFIECDNILKNKSPNSILRTIFLSLIGSTLSDLGMNEKAIELFEENLRIYRERNLEGTFIGAMSYQLYGQVLYQMDDYEESVHCYEKALEIMKKIGANNSYFYAMTLPSLSQSLSFLGRFDEAIEYANKAIEIRDSLKFQDVEFDAGIEETALMIYMKSERYEEMIYKFIDVINSNSLIISTMFPMLTENQRQQYWNSKLKYVYDTLLPLFTHIFEIGPYNKLMYDGLLQSRGVLLNSSITFAQLVSESGDDELQSEYQTFVDNKSEILRIKESGNLNEIKILIKKEQENYVLEQKLLDGIASYGNLTQWSVVNTDSIKKHLGANDLAVEFFIVETSREDDDNIPDTIYYALSLRKWYEYPTLINIGRTDDIRVLKSNPDTKGQELWKKILADNMDVKKIYFAPAGELYNFPIEYCGWENVKTELSGDCRIYRVSSTREIVKELPEFGENAIVYGGIKYDTSIDYMAQDSQKYPEVRKRSYTRRRKNRDTDEPVEKTEFLKWTKTEAERIARSINKSKMQGLDAEILSGENGTEASFKNLSGKRKSIIHVATHGFYDNATIGGDAMMRSGLLFAGVDNFYSDNELPDGIEDGFLYANEIANMDLRGLNMVVLSACQTGLGDVTSEGVFGLQRGFKKAGANTILMSLWDVDDKATQLLMTIFYDRWLKTGNKYDSFQYAQEKVKKKYPYFKDWGAFILLDAIR